MSSIVRQVVGNNVYLYESVSYRNKDGKPRNKRTLIGKFAWAVTIGFVALILMSYIHTVMLDQGLYKNMTIKKMLMTLAKLKVQYKW